MAENSNSGWGTGSPGSTGTGSTGTTGSSGSGSGLGSTGATGTGSSGSGIGSGGTGSGMSGSGGSMGGGMSTGSGGSGGAFGVTSATDRGGMGTGSGTDSDTGVCPHCGQSTKGTGIEQFLGRLGITEDMITNLKTQFQNVEIEEYLNTARDYLKDSSGKASTYAKENPGKVAAGVAALALGAGLIYAATNRDKS